MCLVLNILTQYPVRVVQAVDQLVWHVAAHEVGQYTTQYHALSYPACLA